MKNFFSVVFVTMIVFGLNAQELVRWNNSNFTPNIINNKITADNVTFKTDVTINDAWEGNVKYFQFNTSGWPKPNYTNTAVDTFDSSKYVQFSIAPTSGNKIKISDFGFNYKMQGGSARIKIDYSFNNDFSNAKNLLPVTTVSNGDWKDLKITDFPSVPQQIISSGKKMYIRLYVANTNNAFLIRFLKENNVGPYVKGTVSVDNPMPPITADDVARTSKNNEVSIDVLDNDLYQTTVDLKIATAPKNAAVVITNNKIIYTPKINFVGNDEFYYIAYDKNGDSRLTKVSVTVADEIITELIRWNNNDYSGSVLNSNVAKTSLKAKNIDLSAESWETGVFILDNIGGNKPMNADKYLEFGVDNISSTNDIKPTSFSFTYRGTNNATYSILYSKDPEFKNNVKTLASNISATTSFTSRTFNITDTVLKSKEKLYFRLFVYNTNAQFVIQFNNRIDVTFPISGPTVDGVISNSYITTWTNAANPHWDNGKPNAYKSAAVEVPYNTAKDGSFDAYDLIVKPEGSIKITADKDISVYNKITNLGDGSNFIVESDANLIQINDIANEGKITLKRLTKLPKKGYNYWSSPVTGQNLYQFSDGYNQASNPANPQGTPWNQFFIYNEKNDYFVTSIPNELKLDANSEFLKSRGYAIRGKNSFPTEINATSPEAEFKFVGVPNNGTIESYILKYTNEDHGYNLVGNPYPSNIDLDIFFIENADLIQPIAFFWTNNDMSITTQQGSQYNGNNYAIYNRMGGIPATYKGLNKNIPNISVKTSQGFIIKAKATGQNKALRFTNAMRTKEQGVFFNYKAAEKNRFWLNLKSEADINNEILIGYLEDASNAFDADLDTELLAVGEDAIWSNLDNKQLGIQARSWNDNQEDVVKLGVQLSAAGNYSISLGDVEGIFNQNQNIYLKDNSNSQIIDLSNSSYNFYGEKGIYNERFEIVYKKKETTLAVTEAQKDVLVYKNNDAFVITSKTDNIEEVEVYDALGRLVYQTKPNNKATQISLNQFAKGMFILKISTKTNTLTKKIIN